MCYTIASSHPHTHRHRQTLMFGWTIEIHRVHSSVVRAADCRSAGPWLKSRCALSSVCCAHMLSSMMRHSSFKRSNGGNKYLFRFSICFLLFSKNPPEVAMCGSDQPHLCSVVGFFSFFEQGPSLQARSSFLSPCAILKKA